MIFLSQGDFWTQLVVSVEAAYSLRLWRAETPVDDRRVEEAADGRTWADKSSWQLRLAVAMVKLELCACTYTCNINRTPVINQSINQTSKEYVAV